MMMICLKLPLYLVWDNFDVQLFARIELGRIRQTLVPNLIEGIGGVGDQLAKEDFFVGVESVDDQAHQLSNLGLESKRFRLPTIIHLLGIGHRFRSHLKHVTSTFNGTYKFHSFITLSRAIYNKQ